METRRACSTAEWGARVSVPADAIENVTGLPGGSMRHMLKVSEAVRNFADYVSRVAYRGERFVLVRGNRPVAELGPVPAGKHLGELPELLAALPHLSAREAERFARDLEVARTELAHAPVRDAWES